MRKKRIYSTVSVRGPHNDFSHPMTDMHKDLNPYFTYFVRSDEAAGSDCWLKLSCRPTLFLRHHLNKKTTHRSLPQFQWMSSSMCQKIVCCQRTVSFCTLYTAPHKNDRKCPKQMSVVLQDFQMHISISILMLLKSASISPIQSLQNASFLEWTQQQQQHSRFTTGCGLHLVWWDSNNHNGLPGYGAQ